MTAVDKKSKWATRPLGSCGRWVSGGTPSRQAPWYWNGSIPWISAKSLKTFEISDSEDRITEMAVQDGASLVPAGTVLFVVRGMSLAKEFRVGVTTRPVAFNQDLRGIIPTPDVDSRFLAWFLKGQEQELLGRSSEASHGTMRLPTERIGSLDVPVPPIAEQRRIAHILDLVGALRQKRAEVFCLAKGLLPSVFREMFGAVRSNPMNWPLLPISRIAEFEGGKNLQADDDSVTSARYRILKVSAVTWQEYDPNESKPLPSDYEPPSAHHVREGDLLFSRANTTALVGATAFVFTTPKNMILPDKIWRFVWNEPRIVDPLYVWALFQEPYVRFQIGQRATGTSGSMKNISMAKVREIALPVPPLALQQAFAARIRVVRAIREDQVQSQRELDNLFHSLLQRAFRGDL